MLVESWVLPASVVGHVQVNVVYDWFTWMHHMCIYIVFINPGGIFTYCISVCSQKSKAILENLAKT